MYYPRIETLLEKDIPNFIRMFDILFEYEIFFHDFPHSKEDTFGIVAEFVELMLKTVTKKIENCKKLSDQIEKETDKTRKERDELFSRPDDSENVFKKDAAATMRARAKTRRAGAKINRVIRELVDQGKFLDKHVELLETTYSRLTSFKEERMYLICEPSLLEKYRSQSIFCRTHKEIIKEMQRIDPSKEEENYFLVSSVSDNGEKKWYYAGGVIPFIQTHREYMRIPPKSPIQRTGDYKVDCDTLKELVQHFSDVSVSTETLEDFARATEFCLAEDPSQFTEMFFEGRLPTDEGFAQSLNTIDEALAIDMSNQLLLVIATGIRKFHCREMGEENMRRRARLRNMWIDGNPNIDEYDIKFCLRSDETVAKDFNALVQAFNDSVIAECNRYLETIPRSKELFFKTLAQSLTEFALSGPEEFNTIMQAFNDSNDSSIDECEKKKEQ